MVVGREGLQPVNVKPLRVGVPGLLTDSGAVPDTESKVGVPPLLSKVAVTVGGAS